MPIALVITDLDVGGAERAMVSLATGLDRRRWDPSVVCLGPVGELVVTLARAGIEVHCLEVRRSRPVRAVAKLVSRLRILRPALIQSFLFHANLASKLAAPFAGHPWTIGGIRVAEKEKRWHLTLERRTQRLSTGAICVSEGVREFSIREGGISPDRLLVIPNAIDPLPFDRAGAVSRESLGLPAEARIALFVGRITTQKGLPLLFDGFGQAVRRRPEWWLVIAGDGEYRDQWQAETEANPLLRDRVKWLGRRDDVPALLKAADFLVLPSLWEGMPNVVLEAMAARKPVLASPVEGIDELLSFEGPGRSGWRLRPGSDEDLARAMDDTAGYERMGACGRARVESDFRIGPVVAAYEHIWAGVLGLSREGLPSPGRWLAEFDVKAKGPEGR